MKKVAGFVAATALAGGMVIGLLAMPSGPEAVREVVADGGEAVRDRGRHALGLDVAEPGVVAMVNGESITLEQVEALYDMSTPNLALSAGSTLAGLQYDYASCLQRLILQALIRQELAASGLSVDDEDVLRLEAFVCAGYDMEPGLEFDRHIEEEGISPIWWREQLRARLELERWREQLARSVVIRPEEVEAYIASHPEERVLPEEVDCLVVSGTSKADVKAARASGVTDMADLQARGLDARRLDQAVSAMPEAWRDTVEALAPGERSPLRETNGIWSYAVLLERRPPRERSPLEMFAYVERLLISEKLPQAFDLWLEKALGASDIRMAGQLRPDQVQRPEPAAAPFLLQDNFPVAGATGEEDMP